MKSVNVIKARMRRVLLHANLPLGRCRGECLWGRLHATKNGTVHAILQVDPT